MYKSLLGIKGLNRSFLGPGGITDSTDFLYKMLGKRTFSIFPYQADTSWRSNLIAMDINW